MTVKYNSYIPQAITGLQSATEKAIEETAIRVTSEAKSLAPNDSGQLENSIMWKTPTASGGHTEGRQLGEVPKKFSAVVGTGVEYAIYQELGTKRMNARAFLRPAFSMVVGGLSVKQAFNKAMKQTLALGLKWGDVI